MPIEATVIPQGVPQVGVEVTAETFEKIGTPRVIVPTNNITIQSGETMQVDGTLVINGTLSGGGLTTAITQGLGSLNDVQLANISQGQSLKWDGSKWTNLDDESGIESWDELADKPTEFPPTAHSHPWNDVTSKPTEFNPVTHNHPWNEITNKPTEFSPTAHSHEWDTITSKPTEFNPVSHSHEWDAITSKPTEFVPVSHGHSISDITNLTATLEGKLDTGDLVTSLVELSDTNITSPSDLSTLQYDGVSQKWNAVAQTDFIDSIIDAGYSDADLHYVSGFDLDGGFA